MVRLARVAAKLHICNVQEFELNLRLRLSNFQAINAKNRWLIAFTFFSIICSGCRCPWTCTNTELAESSRYFQNGIAAFHDGKHHEAEHMLSQAIESRPADPILREHLANTYLKQGKTSEAIAELMQAAEISGNDAAISVQIGKLYLKNEQWILADQFAKRALSADRKLAEAWELRGETRLAKGQLTQALSDFQRALSLKNDNPKVQLKVAEVHHLMGRPMRAFSTIEQMLSRMPVDQQPEDALLLAGGLLIEMRQPAQAVEKLRIASGRGNSSPETFVQLANAQSALGRTVEARHALTQGQHKHPENVAIAQRLIELSASSDERIAAVDFPTTEITR